MKVGDLLAARDAGLYDLMGRVALRDGALIYKLRRVMEAIERECKAADAERSRLVLEVEPEKGAIEPGHPEYARIVETFKGWLGIEVELPYRLDLPMEALVEYDPATRASVQIPLTVAQATMLEGVGILKAYEPPEEPKAPKEPKATKARKGR